MLPFVGKLTFPLRFLISFFCFVVLTSASDMMWIGFSLAISVWGSRYFLCLDAYFSSRFGNHSAINLSNTFSILFFFFLTLSQLLPLPCGSLGSVSWMCLRVLEDFDYAYLVLFPYMCLMSWPCPLSLTFFFLCLVMSVDSLCFIWPTNSFPAFLFGFSSESQFSFWKCLPCLKICLPNCQ